MTSIAGFAGVTRDPDNSTLLKGNLRLAVLVGRGGLSTRTANALIRRGLETVTDVRSVPYADLASFRNIGAGALRELIDSGVIDSESATGEDYLGICFDPGTADAPIAGDMVVTGLVPGLLSRRTANALMRGGAETVDHIRRMSFEQLASLRYIGAAGLQQLVDARLAGPHSISSGSPNLQIMPDDAVETSDDLPLIQLDELADLWEAETAEEAVDGTHDDALPQSIDVPVVIAVSNLIELVERWIDPDRLHLLKLRQHETLEAIARPRGVTRERIRQIASKADGRIRRLVELHAPQLIGGWTAAFEHGPVSETVLFSPEFTATHDDAQLMMARIILQAVMPGVKQTHAFKQPVSGYWKGPTADEGCLEQSLRELAEFGPYSHTELAEAMSTLRIEPALAMRVLEFEGSPLVRKARVKGWVRRVAQARDACFLILDHAQRPVSQKVLGRILEITPRNVSANLERDDRFRWLYGQKRWALVAWGDLGDGTRYRTTKEAMLDVLKDGPLEYEELVSRVQAVHPVTVWAVHNWLEDEVFGRFPDGSYGMTYQGGVPHEDEGPPISDDIEEPHDRRCIAFYMPVTKDLLRGSGLGVPPYVTWFAGLRRVPRARRFQRADGPELTLSRRAGYSTISALRLDAEQLGLREDCALRIELDLVNETACMSAGCLCHRAVAE